MPPHTISPSPSSQGLGISFSTLSPPPVDPSPQRLTGMVPRPAPPQASPTRSHPPRGPSDGRGQSLFQPAFSLRPTHTRSGSGKGFTSFSALAPSPANNQRPMGPRASTAVESPRLGGPSKPYYSGGFSTDSGEQHREGEDVEEEETPKQQTRNLPSPSRTGSIASNFSALSKQSRKSKSSEMLRKFSRGSDTFGAGVGKYRPLSGEDEEEPSSTMVESSPPTGSIPMPHPRRPSTRSRSGTITTSNESNNNDSPSRASYRTYGTDPSQDTHSNNIRNFPFPPSHEPRTATAYSDPTSGMPYYRYSHPPSRPLPRSVSQPQYLHSVPEFQFDPARPPVRPLPQPQPDSAAMSKRASDISSGIHSKNAALLSAESGGMMLAFSPTGDGTYRAGEIICGSGTGLIPSHEPRSPEKRDNDRTATPEDELKARPWSDSTMSQHLRKPTMLGRHGRSLSDGAQLLARQGTLLHPSSSNQRASAELGVLLGGPKSRRLSQGKLLPPPPDEQAYNEMWEKNKKVRLEASKKGKARVEVDVVLERECVVEGGEVRGRLEVRITGGKRGEGLRVGGGKVRVVGFEEISGSSRHIFYHQPHALPVFDPSIQHNLSSSLFASGPDSDGYRLAAEGTHSIPFRMRLPLGGGAKGTYTPPGGKGPCVRYVVVGSVKIHIPATGKRSIAHFYRSVVVLPYLNPSVVLSPSQEPVEGYVERGLGWSLTGEKGRVELRVSLGRRVWVSGQRLWCEVGIRNDSTRKIKTLNLAILQTVQIFNPQPMLDTENLPTRLVKKRRSLQNCTGIEAVPGTPDVDACQTTTQRRKVSEEMIEADFTNQGAGRVTGKGWWTGVETGESGHWDMSIQVPPGMLSIRRTRLIEVQYILRVTLNGTIYVDLPIQLINFLSIDPPPMPSDSASRLVSAPISQSARAPGDMGIGADGQPLKVGINYDVYQQQQQRGVGSQQDQSRPLGQRYDSNFTLDSAAGPARASSTTLHIDALLQAGRARAEAEAQAQGQGGRRGSHDSGHTEITTKQRPMSIGSAYTAERGAERSSRPASIMSRTRSNPNLRPKGARGMSFQQSGKSDARSVFSDDLEEEEEEEDAQEMDKAVLAARMAQGRQRSLAIIHHDLSREARDAFGGADQEDILSPGRETPPDGEFRPCDTPSEEVYNMVGDTPESKAEAEARTPLTVAVSVESHPGLEVIEGDAESQSNHVEHLHQHQDQDQEDDGQHEEMVEKHNGLGVELGDETVLENMVPEDREELEEVMSQQGHGDDQPDHDANQYDYAEEVESEDEDIEADVYSPAFQRLPFLNPGETSMLSRDQHIAQTRSMYGSFANSAVSGVSEQESEVGQVYQATKRNVSVRLPPRLLPLPQGEAESNSNSNSTSNLNVPRSGSVPHTLLAHAQRRGSHVSTHSTAAESGRRDSINSVRSAGNPVVARRGSTTTTSLGLTAPVEGLAARRGSSVVAQSSPLRPTASDEGQQRSASPAPSGAAKVITKKSSFSFATPKSPLRVKIPLTTGAGAASPDPINRHLSPAPSASSGLSPRSTAPQVKASDMVRGHSANSTSHLRNEVVMSPTEGSPNMSGDEDHIPGLAPSIASDSGSSSEGNPLYSPPAFDLPHITTSPPPNGQHRSLPYAPSPGGGGGMGYQPFPTSHSHLSTRQKEMTTDQNWNPGHDFLLSGAATQVNFMHHHPQGSPHSPIHSSPRSPFTRSPAPSDGGNNNNNSLSVASRKAMRASVSPGPGSGSGPRRESSLPLPLPLPIGYDETSSLGGHSTNSPHSSPSSCHSILPSVKNKIAQLESRDEALRKFSVSGAAVTTTTPSSPARKMSSSPAPVPAPAPVARPSLALAGGSPSGQTQSKRKSYTTALAPRPVRSTSDDSYSHSYSSQQRQPVYERGPNSAAPGGGGGLGHTTWVAKRYYAPERQSSYGPLAPSEQGWAGSNDGSVRSRTSNVPSAPQSMNGSLSLSPRTMMVPRLDPFGLGFGSGSVGLHHDQDQEQEHEQVRQQRVRVRPEQEQGQYDYGVDVEHGQGRNQSFASHSTSATDIERALNNGTTSQGQGEGEQHKVVKPKVSGFWQDVDRVGYKVFDSASGSGSGSGGSASARASARDARVSLSEATDESDGLL
ncbi:hypothetical protein CI109_100764 [Kwoniella shandongensis]|uniref:Uncharacterized protein n=1 Tax=Kwoniella shandongensis TaxID=1734106 RepID=A0A5M6BUX2_9TREE|nr:uncharacterized protein CI109_005056 [Kwoniella shandongensis]KAA5526666.1 hypothetical protein CI109_005056 [Kwoniella shandongensis]